MSSFAEALTKMDLLMNECLKNELYHLATIYFDNLIGWNDEKMFL